ncbi:MAG: YiiG family protein [Acidobacteriota bacterium]
MTTKHTNLLTAITALAVLMTVSLGCSQLAKLRQKGTNSNNTGPAYPTPTKQGTPAQTKSGVDEKTQLYITKCFNPYANSVMDSYQRYTSWIKDVDKGPTGKEMNIYGLYEIHGDGQDCATAMEQANDMDPDLPEVEQDAAAYSSALKDAIEKVNEVYKYYDQGDYKDDNFQKGKEAHAGLIQAFKSFETADKKFGADLDDLEDKVSTARLDEIRDDPSKRFEFTVVDFNMKAKKISNYAQHTKYPDMSADDLQKLADDLEPAINAMKDAGKTKTMASMYFSSADELLKDTKELMRRIRDHKPFDSFEKGELGTAGGWMVEGSPDKVIYAYNQLISQRSLLSIGGI